MNEQANSEASRAQSIAGLLRSQIMSGKYGPGERLPSERELAVRLGGSRTSAREALKRLEHEGMVTIRRGGGARVRPIEEAGLTALQHLLASTGLPRKELVAQWLDVQELVIAGAARFAAERSNEEELARTKELLKQLTREDSSDDELIATIDELTDLIAVASRNVVLRMVHKALAAQGRRHARKKRAIPRTWRGPLAQMVRAIERALDRRDSAGVEKSVRALLLARRGAILERMAQDERARSKTSRAAE
jgi:GntR family transcriptional regulator, transcriptional repressor for pyruvate dehydrogenase complex